MDKAVSYGWGFIGFLFVLLFLAYFLKYVSTKNERVKSVVEYINNRWEGMAVVLVLFSFFSGCIYTTWKSDSQAKQVNKETRYFKVTNKDYKDISRDILSENYRYVIYITRYDNDKKRVSSRHELNQIAVTKHEYDMLEVGEIYPASKVDVRSYGYY